MKHTILISLFAVVLLSGCQTLQSPQQRQQEAARRRAAERVVEERLHRLQARVEAVESENARLAQHVEHLRSQLGTYGQQIAQVDSNLRSVEARQGKQTQEVVKRVEGLLKKAAPARKSTASRGNGREHVVESGHTLSAIAQAYGTTVKAIKQVNNLKSDNIYIGQKLFIPE